MLVPCTVCRRHVRDGAPCAFCGGAPSDTKPVVVEGHVSRRYAATLTAFGIAIAIDASACGAYGGPPSAYRRTSGEFRTSRERSTSDTLDDVVARGKAHGCRVDRFERHAYVYCEGRTMMIDSGGDDIVVTCEHATDAECRAAYEQFAKP
jgi:hypothetical protein